MSSAIIDIGSNSVRLMLRADGKTLYKKIETTRLGAGLAATHALSEEAIERTALAVRAFCEEGRACGAEVYAFATEAVRSAKNGGAFCNRVKELCGLEVDVASGEEEARLAVLGALSGRDGGIVDIGGASTEVSYVKGGERAFSTSIPMGCVRLYDLASDKKEMLEKVISGAISPLSAAEPFGTTYVVGGTASTLASILMGLETYDGEKLQDFEIGIRSAEETADMLLSMTVEERKRVRGMDLPRADIIGGGVLLLARIMRMLRLESVRFSDRDNLEGYATLRGIS